MGRTNDIRAAVEAELRFDPLVDAADIAVRNINGPAPRSTHLARTGPPA